MFERIFDFYINLGVGEDVASLLALASGLLIVFLLAVVLNFIAKRFLVRGLRKAAGVSHTRWDDMLVEQEVFLRLSHLLPALVIYGLAPYFLSGNEQWVEFVQKGALIYIIFVGVIVIYAMLDACVDIYHSFDISRQVPIRSTVQVLRVATILGAIFLAMSVVLERSALVLVSGLGVSTAILMLIFQDPILGFLAGLTLTANKMLARGDIIEMPKYDADGEVIDLALTTVKIQNNDKSITAVPTQALITESFKNWRGRKEFGGRRIKRSINIDISSIKMCEDTVIERFRDHPYLRERLEGIVAEDDGTVVDDIVPGGSNVTNLGLFRAYVEAYLRRHPRIIQEVAPFVIRTLAPTESGVPLEIYVFSDELSWAPFENIQSDIFDHLLAVISEFNLRVFQNPTGRDFRSIN